MSNPCSDHRECEPACGSGSKHWENPRCGRGNDADRSRDFQGADNSVTPGGEVFDPWHLGGELRRGSHDLHPTRAEK